MKDMGDSSCDAFYHYSQRLWPQGPMIAGKDSSRVSIQTIRAASPPPSHTHSKARESQSSLQQRQARLRRAIHRRRERGVTDVSERAWRPIDGQGHTSICRLRSWRPVQLVPPPPRDRSETTPPRIERGAQRWCLVFCGRVAQPCVGWGQCECRQVPCRVSLYRVGAV